MDWRSAVCGLMICASGEAIGFTLADGASESQPINVDNSHEGDSDGNSSPGPTFVD